MPDEREVIQGPFKTDAVKNGRVSVVPGEGGDIWLVLDKPKSSGENERSVIAVYKEDGGIPEVETVFFYPVRGVKNVVVLISRKVCLMALGTHGRYYEIHSYAPTGNGLLVENQLVKTDGESEGMDGFSEGDPSVFAYKNAALIKFYLKKFN
ncbi:hypothetical protein [Pseudomonas sp. NPDC089406]|uniref:hypothetical protein n=1 Tax=Pseudomonas sp. NPDC089406 TaxID=3364463 RepID=UPI00384DCAF4